MKKNWKFFAYSAAAAVIQTMTACSADGDTEHVSFVEKIEIETEPLSLAGEEMQETGTVNLSSTEEEAQDTVAENLSSEKKETQDMETENSSSVEETQDTETEDYLIFDNPILLEDYYNTPDGKAAIEADFEDLAGAGMSVTISVIKDSIYVIVKYEDSTLLTEGIEETLAQQLEFMTDRFWKWTIAYDKNITWRCVLTVRYIDSDGNVLAEQSYSAE